MIEDCFFGDEGKKTFFVFGRGLRILTSELIWVRLDSVCFSILLREISLCVSKVMERKVCLYNWEEFSTIIYLKTMLIAKKRTFTFKVFERIIVIYSQMLLRRLLCNIWKIHGNWMLNWCPLNTLKLTLLSNTAIY